MLPRAEFETEEEAEVRMPRLRSRRYALKVMTRGIIGKPVPDHGFDGEIYLKRVASDYVTKQNSFNLNISEESKVTIH